MLVSQEGDERCVKNVCCCSPQKHRDEGGAEHGLCAVRANNAIRQGAPASK